MVARKYSEKFAHMERTTTSLRTRYQKAVKEVSPTGNPNCPVYVRLAKKCDRDVFQRQKYKLVMILMNLL